MALHALATCIHIPIMAGDHRSDMAQTGLQPNLIQATRSEHAKGMAMIDRPGVNSAEVEHARQNYTAYLRVWPDNGGMSQVTDEGTSPQLFGSNRERRSLVRWIGTETP